MLALIAGTGGLPRLLAERATAAGDPPVICVLRGFEPSVPEDLPRLDFRLETFGTLLATLVEVGVERLCMAGAVRRSAIDPAAIDARTAPLVPRLTVALARGDDGTLREIVAIIEETGIAVIGAETLAPDLLPPAGVPTSARPAPEHSADAAAGDAALARMGRADSGQAVVLRGGRVLAEEGPEGTAALIAGFQGGRVRQEDLPGPLDDLRRALTVFASRSAPSEVPGAGAVLYKAPKPGQDRRVDLPLIGPETVMESAAAGFAGIVIEAGGVLVLDLPLVVELCDARGLFLWVRPVGGGA